MFLNFTSMLFGLGWMSSIAAPSDCDWIEIFISHCFRVSSRTSYPNQAAPRFAPMSKVYHGIDEALTCFIAAQHAFFVATVPLDPSGHV